MLRRTLILFIFTLFCWNCAQQGSPKGGPRDEDPPVVLECSPQNYSVHFDARRIEVTFDEYVVLDNVNRELVVSPPMEEKPEVKLRKRTMIIQLVDSLKANTTYTFNFGSAIKDLHEGNQLLNYEYVFSTGAELDSMSVKGSLKYAEDLSIPEEPITILLYTDLNDTVPLRDLPLYVGRSNDSGVYSVNNLRVAEYKVFALKDGNNNFLYDLPSEEIAFADSTLLLDPVHIRNSVKKRPTDSLSVDSLSMESPPADNLLADSLLVDAGLVAVDSTLADSLRPPPPTYNSVYLDMKLFTEEVLIQYLMSETREQRRLIQLAFAQPLSDSFSYRFMRPRLGTRVEVLEDFSAGRDSLDLWLLDSLDFKQDSLYMELQYTMLDSFDLPYMQVDTLLFSYRDRSAGRNSGRRKGPEVKKEELTLNTIRASGEHNLNRHLRLELNYPLGSINDSLMSLFTIPDSVEIPAKFQVQPDSADPLLCWIESPWESATSYRLQILPGAVQSIYEMAHDTLDVKFRTRDSEYYGQIFLNLENVQHPLQVQLKSGDKIVREVRIDSDGVHTFDYLSPRDYTFKIIHDLNDNGKWDTGHYLEKRQPEPVEIISKKVTVRSNWDHEVNYRLKH